MTIVKTRREKSSRFSVWSCICLFLVTR